MHKPNPQPKHKEVNGWQRYTKTWIDYCKF